MAGQVCAHCNGTTFCGGFKRKGTLVTQAACPTCLVRSGLNPKEVHHRVVCAVCGGTGMVQPRKRPAGISLLLVSPLLLLAGAVLALSSVAFYRYLTRDDEIREGAARTIDTAPRRVSAEELKKKLSVGMDKDEVQEVVGKPNLRQQFDEGGSVMELWWYNCKDGQVRVSIRDDHIISVQ
jgi:hypothetical protein